MADVEGQFRQPQLHFTFPMHHIATIRRPWPFIPGAATTVSHTGSEDSLVFLLPTSTASSLAFAPQQLGGMHTGVTLKQQTNRLM